MSFFRNTVWFIKGMKEYTKSGFLSASRNFNANDLDVDCAGKSYMITGANSGLGKETAIELAKRGGTVHMVCRNKERGEVALQEIKKDSSNEKVHLHVVDMSKPRDILKFALDFIESGEQLNVLVNNAGCMVNQRELTEDGFEKNFATNTLGTHILTTTMIPLLQKSQAARVIIVSSGGMLVQKLNGKDLQFEQLSPFDGTMAYAQNKRQQIVMTETYSKLWPDIHFSSMHPGWSDTPAVQQSMPDFHAKMKDKLRSIPQGADTIVWLCISEAALQRASGLFFQDRQPVNTHLPLAWTRSSASEEESFMQELNSLTEKFTQP
ncbi:hypothetical protein CAPTEDRAFT_161927 [Capitella teleta]|uniref:Dehydrogenase/reductase (SDR family) member 12 n=1 Tax=Capitella teleta TaxID=283909 RepID=R7U581_CAPTE|nr:hypothetical protein CAPTEDRAFT_161927 [Capitella teleta]|eukprot:ELT98831.1 hypothetical protein CAPTEDRAFT_161927 [Capitella teleta]